jgi:hypothetical protein
MLQFEVYKNGGEDHFRFRVSKFDEIKVNGLTLKIKSIGDASIASYHSNVHLGLNAVNNAKLVVSVIFNGILEYLLMMENGIPSEKNVIKIFSLQDSRALNGLGYYIECLINLDYPGIINLNLSNVGIT